MRRPRTPSRRCSGVGSAGWRCSNSASRPSSVAIPVATTTPAPRPPVTAVPRNAMLRRSASSESSISGRDSTCLVTGVDSPVRAASLTRSAHDSVRRRSAATRSPGPSSTRSPGTSSAAGSSCIPPPRRTHTIGAVIALSAAIARSARYSWTKPSRPLRTRMARITTVSLRSPSAAATPAATSSTTITVLANCSVTSRQVGLRASSTSTFPPNRASRLAASPSGRPATGSVPRSAATRWGGRAQGRSMPSRRGTVGWSVVDRISSPLRRIAAGPPGFGPSQSRSPDSRQEGPGDRFGGGHWPQTAATAGPVGSTGSPGSARS